MTKQSGYKKVDKRKNSKPPPPTARPSSNWRYLTEEDMTGPWKDDMLMATTLAKKQYKLETSDIEKVRLFSYTFSFDPSDSHIFPHRW
jgi:hypothetical protein